ncbi:MAG: glycosyltransferase family 2 protein [Erysipelotrichaceae bacterium]|nr:glycosyltransferase family 2 protein [Erysipelotrichaceae bacterium]
MKLIVLLSTYNGEKYLREQLDSLLSQTLLPTKIIIRDDGSKDETLSIIEEYMNDYDFIEFYKGKNLGAGKSFWNLLKKCEDADYYAFCDQDDVWMKEKLEKAVEMLKKEDNSVPLLYCGRYTLTDEMLNPINSEISSLYDFADFEHSLIYHTAPGCTFVFNDKARKMALKYDVDEEYFVIHDAIIHRVTALFGKVILDHNSYIYYRQHGNNEIGMNAKGFEEFKGRVSRFLNGKSKCYRSNTAKSLLKVYGDECDEDRREKIDIVANYMNNSSYKRKLMSMECFKSHTINDLFFKVLVLVNYI